MKSLTTFAAVLGLAAFGASAATSDTFSVDPLNADSQTITLDKYNGGDTLLKATVTVSWSFTNPVQGLSTPVASFTQTGLTNLDANSAEADLNSTILADVVGIGGAVDGADTTQTSVQVLTNGADFDFTGEEISKSFSIVYTGGSLSFFDGAGTFAVDLDIDGGWDVFQFGSGGQGSVNAIFDSAIGGTVEVDYETTTIPTPSAAITGIIGLCGLAMRRPRK
jgi:hypothetical protein